LKRREKRPMVSKKGPKEARRSQSRRRLAKIKRKRVTKKNVNKI